LAAGLNFQAQTSKVADLATKPSKLATLHNVTHSELAHVFVINTADKVGKCQCISAQMAESKIPYSVSKLIAATPDTYKKECKKVPGLQGMAQRPGASTNEGSESALFCSNYKAWNEALEKHADKDYIIILEDDVLLKGKADFWQKVDDFLSSECQDWDYMNVDPYEGAHFRPSHAKAKCSDFKVMNPTTSGGAHMQILKRDKLRDLISHVEKHGAGVVDAPHGYMPKKMRRYSWKANIVQQFNAKFHAKVKQSLKPAYCSTDVYKHQVTMRQTYGEKAASLDEAFKSKSGMQLAFSCEN
jgi:GR25 family glycosyltransferase involved in LPS biosynthesis